MDTLVKGKGRKQPGETSKPKKQKIDKSPDEKIKE